MSAPITILLVLFVVVEIAGAIAAIWAMNDVRQLPEEAFTAAGTSKAGWIRILLGMLVVLQGIGGLLAAAWFVLRVRPRVIGA